MLGEREMRYLTCVTLGFAGACALSAFWLGSFPMAGLGALFLWLYLRGISRENRKWKAPALVVLGLMLGFFWFSLFENLYAKPLKALDGQTVSTSVTLTGFPTPSSQGTSADGVAILGGRPCRVRCYFGSPRNIHPGDRAVGSFRIQEIPWRNKRMQALFNGQATFLRAFPHGELTFERPEHPPLWTAPARMGKYAENTIYRCFSGETAAFASSLLLGDNNRLDFKTNWNLRISGIRHLVAVSGLHVAVLFALLGNLTLHRRWITGILGLPLLLFFCTMTGFTPSVLRACLMMSLVVLAPLFKRDYDPLTGLSAAVLVMLILNPLVITSISFQLSAASVAGILLFDRPVEIWFLKHSPSIHGLPRWVTVGICGSLALSFSSLVFVTPLLTAHFGCVSLIAPLTNLLTVWLVPFLFWGILGVVALSLLSMGAARILGAFVGLGIRYVLWVSAVLAKIPVAAVFTRSLPMLIWVTAVYLLGLVLLTGKVRRVRRFLELSALGLILAFCLSWGIPRLSGFQMTAVDVGQGQCIFLRSQGKNYLVDCGGDREEDAAERAAEIMMSQGFFSLDGLILTHYDRDHVGGAEYLLSLVDAERIYLPPREGLPADSRIRPVQDSLAIPWKDTVLRIVGGGDSRKSNEMSLCVLLDSPVYDILITGDRSEKGEQALLSGFSPGKVDCLVAGHHGAKNSTSRQLLEAVRPDTVVISVGKTNPFGHPAAETLLRLHEFGCRILRTDLLGSITIRR